MQKEQHHVRRIKVTEKRIRIKKKSNSPTFFKKTRRASN
jgi:hypothetical protein